MYFTIEIRRLAFYIFCVIKRGIEVVGINKNILMADVKCTVSDVGSPIGVYFIIYFKYVSRGTALTSNAPAIQRTQIITWICRLQKILLTTTVHHVGIRMCCVNWNSGRKILPDMPGQCGIRHSVLFFCVLRTDGMLT